MGKKERRENNKGKNPQQEYNLETDSHFIMFIMENLQSFTIQFADIGGPTGNGKKLSCTQACCLAQLCLGAP